jgi:hypothetical protein
VITSSFPINSLPYYTEPETGKYLEIDLYVKYSQVEGDSSLLPTSGYDTSKYYLIMSNGRVNSPYGSITVTRPPDADTAIPGEPDAFNDPDYSATDNVYAEFSKLIAVLKWGKAFKLVGR